ncbi:MAG: pinensin family lanthipeptide [Cyclobacteriaceae bacterium]
MKKAKMTLDKLKVNSFVTGSEKVKGGTRWSMYDCPHTGAPSLDYIGCNSLNDFYCDLQPDPGFEDDPFG